MRLIVLPSDEQGTLLDDGGVTVHTIRHYGPTGPVGSLLELRRVTPAESRPGPSIFTSDFDFGVLHYKKDGGIVVRPQPFEDGNLFTPIPSGYGFILVERRVSSPATQFFAVKSIDGNGRVTHSVVIPYHPKEVDSKLIESAVRAMLAGPEQYDRGLVERLREAVKVPHHLPPVTQVLAGSDGSIWLRREETFGRSAEWTVIRGWQNRTLTITLDNSLRLLAVSNNGFWALKQNGKASPQILRFSVR